MACKSGLFAITAVAAVFLGGCINLPGLTPTKLERVVVQKSPRWFETNRIALVDVDGFIGSGVLAWFTGGGTTVADVKEKLNLAAEDGGVRAVVLRINSPGGEASASDMIHQEVLRFKEKTNKPVIAAFTGTATSGAYYVACAADYIVASPTSVTGSVGVIMQFVNVEGLYGKIGLRSEVIKSGKMKDIGSPTRMLTPEERAVLQGINTALFEQFLQAVRKGRPNMTREQVDVIREGSVVSAQEAERLNMVDGIGYLEEAIAKARERAGIRAADVILYRAFPTYNSNIYARPGVDLLVEGGMEFLLRRHGPTFLYLWSPGY